MFRSWTANRDALKLYFQFHNYTFWNMATMLQGNFF